MTILNTWDTFIKRITVGQCSTITSLCALNAFPRNTFLIYCLHCTIRVSSTSNTLTISTGWRLRYSLIISYSSHILIWSDGNRVDLCSSNLNLWSIQKCINGHSYCKMPTEGNNHHRRCIARIRYCSILSYNLYPKYIKHKAYWWSLRVK